MLQLSYYTYWSGLPVDGIEIVIRPDRGWAAMPTNDGLTLLVVGCPYGESTAYKADVEASYLKNLELADHVRRATREIRFAGGAVPNFFRKPFGGWARRRRGLDQGSHHGPGDQRRLPRRRTVLHRLDETFSAGRPYDAAMTAYQHGRDAAVLPIYDFTTQPATLQAPPLEMQQLLGAVHDNQDTMDAFAGIIAGTVSPVEFFDPEHIGRIMSAAAWRRPPAAQRADGNGVVG